MQMRPAAPVEQLSGHAQARGISIAHSHAVHGAARQTRPSRARYDVALGFGMHAVMYAVMPHAVIPDTDSNALQGTSTVVKSRTLRTFIQSLGGGDPCKTVCVVPGRDGAPNMAHCQSINATCLNLRCDAVRMRLPAQRSCNVHRRRAPRGAGPGVAGTTVHTGSPHTATGAGGVVCGPRGVRNVSSHAYVCAATEQSTLGSRPTHTFFI